MGFEPTKRQQDAINAKGNILVAAAAGSGKTAVLVERVITKLCSKEEHIDADRLLIVTFTNAAAAEMRSRIEQRLDEECRKNPNDVSLKMQKYLLASAKICTIDSFCIDLVRENFEKLNISPDFKISDAFSLKAIDDAVISQIVNRYLENQDPVFAKLLDIIGTEYDEGNFLQFVEEIYNYSRQLPFPEKWFREICDYYNGGVFDEGCIWAEYAFKLAVNIAEELIISLDNAKELLTVSEKAVLAYNSVFSSAQEILSEFKFKALKRDWDAVYNMLQDFKIPSLPSNVRGLSGLNEVAAAKSIYGNISKTLTRIEKLFYADKAFLNLQFKKLYQPIRLLGEILIEYDNALFAEYNRRNTFTFHNTEHMALRLLCCENNGKTIINPEAEELINRFDEVMVDEYQDTNDLQDMLFYVLSDRERKLFVVGDVKQSIYGFRGANPKNFLNKKNRYIPFDEADKSMPQKIILSNNFRCAPASCEFINFFFNMFMNENTGDIIYNEEERLFAAAKYPQVDAACCEFDIIDCKESDKTPAELEAIRIADYIENTMREGDIIRVDNEHLRPAKYSDFAILVRSAKLKAPIIAEELKRRSIPVNFANESFAESVEVATFLQLLCVIDNPLSDVELLCVLMSPIFGFSAEELAILRADCKEGSLYSAVVFAAEKGSAKAQQFLKKLENFRLLAATMPLPSLISRLLNDTEYLNIVSLMSDGPRRRANLLLLCSFAERFSADGYTSLSGFVKQITLQSEKGGIKGAAVFGGDAVKIMNIHTSKGLQFPVCILAGLSSNFYDNDAKKPTLYSTDFGIGFKYYDEESKIKVSTLSREALLDRSRAVSLEEELRLFYVAMTRTQDRLVFISALENMEKKLSDLTGLLISSGQKINHYVFGKTKSYSDWMLLCLLLHPDGKELRGNGNVLIPSDTESHIKLCCFDGNSLNTVEFTNETTEYRPDSELLEKIISNLAFKYPYSTLTELESKTSVSRLANSAESAKFAFSARPAFMNSGGITSAERGTALHKVMQYFDFEKCDLIENELERLYEWQFISERERDSINIKALENFFKSDIFARMKRSHDLRREMRFLTEIPAKNLTDKIDCNLLDENVIVQGAVDVCFVENDGLVILDFKTDRVESPCELSRAYGEQLEFYAKACEKIFGLPIKQKIIYSFCLEEEIAL